MRHVDDAHHAEGDGKSDRRKQQNGTEAQSVDGVLKRIPPGAIAFERSESLLRGPRDAVLAARNVRQAERRHPGRPLVFTISMAAIRSSSAAVEVEDESGDGLLHRKLHGGVGLLAERFAQWLHRCLVAAAEYFFCRLEARRRIGREQCQAADDRLDLPSDLVVDGDLVERRLRAA